ncbi:MAG: TIGR03088 family PEP-CTERM/XrtA system glycosyltransferase [Gammaproteobacteria bacterium]|nr:TIGR03088 family PEP-CTERM/XrtA system glycosyltransferase [Gammaproteobacteria bacterium]MBQ0840789.1 TIGR03088 family PEP-CTERM/XrtA system glycosyltransferase [Gammaproteobacteria bacterium]
MNERRAESVQQAPVLIAHVIYALGTGGLENGLVNIINRAPPERYRHVIICLTRAEGFESRITAPDVEVISLHKRPGHDLAVFWRLWRVLWKLRPAIVHTRNLAALEMQIMAALIPGVKRVHGEHGRDIHDIDGSNKKYNFLRKALRPLVHRYIAVSEDLAQWLTEVVEVPAKKVKQIYNGVDQQVFSPGAATITPPASFMAENVQVIGTVGRLAEVKDQLTLIQAFAQLVADHSTQKQLRLVIVGDGPMHQTLSAKISELGLSEYIWMPGDREDIPELLRLMDVFVLPSLGEGISNTLLEAMATGLPLIATRVGGNPELIEEGINGCLVPVGDPVALAKSLKTLLSKPKMLTLYGEKSLHKVRQHFDWNRTVDEYLAVYDQLLGRPPHESGSVASVNDKQSTSGSA